MGRPSLKRLPLELLEWARSRGPRVDPFTPAQHPPQVMERVRAERMAMDQDTGVVASVSWASGVAVASTFHEGLAFLGYPFLAELAQRAEYRRPSEILAFEMTREWIEFSETETEEEAKEDEAKGEPEGEPEDEPPAGAAGDGMALDVGPDAADFDPDDAQLSEAGEHLMAEPPGEGEGEGEGDDRLKERRELKRKIAELEDALEELQVREVFRRMVEQDGHFGRGHVYVDTGDGDDPDELRTSLATPDGRGNPNKVSPKHPLLALRTVEAVWAYPTRYNSSDPLEADWYKPDHWLVMRKELHKSRFITFIGREVSDLLKPAYSFGGLSLTQMMKPYVDNWLRGRQSISDLIHNFSVSGVMTDMSALLQAGSRSLQEKVEFFRNVRDNKSVMLLNKDSEQFFQVNTPLSGLSDLQGQLQEHMAAVCGIPIVKLLGIQPAGLNASSEGELQAFYDWIGSLQERLMRQPLRYVVDLVQLSLWGEVDERITFRFKPLRITEEKAEAERRKMEAEIDDIYVAMGAIDPQEVRERIAKDPEAPYGLIDPQDMPAPPQQPGEAGGGGAKPGDPGDNPLSIGRPSPAVKSQRQVKSQEAA